MTAYATDTLDLSRIQVADIIPALSYDDLRGRFVTAFLTYWNALRVKDSSLPEYTVDMLESDPAVVVGEAASFVRTLERGAFDDRIRQLLLVSATGKALDLIGTTYYGVPRMIIPAVPATFTPEIQESDARYKLRLQLAPEAGLPRAKVRARLGAAKTLGGYVFHALSYDLRVAAADAASLERGNVTVAILAEDGEDPDVVTASARSWLSRDDVKGATDILVVRPATVLTVDVAATLYALNGPDGGVLTAAAETAYRGFVTGRGPFRAPLYGKAIDAALQVPGIETLDRTLPAGDVLSPFGTVIRPGTVTLDVQRVGPAYG